MAFLCGGDDKLRAKVHEAYAGVVVPDAITSRFDRFRLHDLDCPDDRAAFWLGGIEKASGERASIAIEFSGSDMPVTAIAKLLQSRVDEFIRRMEAARGASK